MALIEDGIFAYLSSQSNITTIAGSRIYGQVLPQDATLPAVVFNNIASVPLDMLNGKPVMDRTRIQVDCYARNSHDAKLLAKAIRDSLESYVGPLGSLTARCIRCIEYGVDDFDDVPNDFRVTSEFEIWHTV